MGRFILLFQHTALALRVRVSHAWALGAIPFFFFRSWHSQAEIFQQKFNWPFEFMAGHKAKSFFLPFLFVRLFIFGEHHVIDAWLVAIFLVVGIVIVIYLSDARNWSPFNSSFFLLVWDRYLLQFVGVELIEVDSLSLYIHFVFHKMSDADFIQK